MVGLTVLLCNGPFTFVPSAFKKQQRVADLQRLADVVDQRVGELEPDAEWLGLAVFPRHYRHPLVVGLAISHRVFVGLRVCHSDALSHRVAVCDCRCVAVGNGFCEYCDSSAAVVITFFVGQRIPVALAIDAASHDHADASSRLVSPCCRLNVVVAVAGSLRVRLRHNADTRGRGIGGLR